MVHPRCRHTIDELTTYSYKIDPLTDQILPILEDKNNHVIDSIRYMCEGLRRTGAFRHHNRTMSVERNPVYDDEDPGTYGREARPGGWMAW